MPTPKKYADSNELIRSLRVCHWREWFSDSRGEEKDSDLKLIIRHSVGPNIFRAFRHLPEKPSVVFREWAYDSLDKRFLSDLTSCNSRPHYRRWAYAVSDSLRDCWEQRTGHEMPYGPSLKLTNLVAKRLCLFRGISLAKVERLIWLLEVPLDIYTIQAVANCVSGFPGHSAIGRVPASATMSFIKNQMMYEAFQEGIHQIASEAGAPSIALDCVAWDAAH